MAIASGANSDISYVREVTHGVTPGSPSMKLLRATGRNVNGVKTIDTHRANLKAKLGLSNTAELVRYAIKWCLDSHTETAIVV